MQFLRQVIGSLSSDPRAHRVTASTGRRRSRIELETLESRNLQSIPGVSLIYGNLAIKATKSSGNVAHVWIDSATHNVKVSLNGRTEMFAASKVANITYKGGANGGDTFDNDTNRTTLAWGYGGRNRYTGGTRFNYSYYFGNNNTYTAQGGVSTVWRNYGAGVAIVNPLHASVTVYST
jgi:hypothetical protein